MRAVLLCMVVAAVPALVAPPRRVVAPRRAGAAPSPASLFRGSSVALRGVPELAAFDPATFAPVCVASDALYRTAQGSVNLLVGPDVYKEYAPLIAGGLLRLRLELCVVESFFTEAIVPFVRDKGLSWVLPFHETVETFLAGTIFALALNFILVGSTKIVQVVVTYVDFFLGMPTRFLGSKAVEKLEADDAWADESSNGPAIAALSGVRLLGDAIGVVRSVVDFVDVFVSRYLALTTAAYITFKFLHFRVFP